jgi:hypothetical protein
MKCGGDGILLTGRLPGGQVCLGAGTSTAVDEIVKDDMFD